MPWLLARASVESTIGSEPEGTPAGLIPAEQRIIHACVQYGRTGRRRRGGDLIDSAMASACVFGSLVFTTNRISM